MERCLSLITFGIDIGTMRNEAFYHIKILITHGSKQWSLTAVLTFRINIDTERSKKIEDINFFSFGCPAQQIVYVRIREWRCVVG